MKCVWVALVLTFICNCWLKNFHALDTNDIHVVQLVHLWNLRASHVKLHHVLLSKLHASSASIFQTLREDVPCLNLFQIASHILHSCSRLRGKKRRNVVCTLRSPSDMMMSWLFWHIWKRRWKCSKQWRCDFRSFFLYLRFKMLSTMKSLILAMLYFDSCGAAR